MEKQEPAGGGSQFDITEDLNLFQLLNKEGVIGVAAFFNQQVASFFDDSGALGTNIDIHGRS